MHTKKKGRKHTDKRADRPTLGLASRYITTMQDWAEAK